jgi:hypothetical protein
MTNLLLWMIMCYGISNILVYGSIFNGPRNKINQWAADVDSIFQDFWIFLSDMLKCMMCTPTWVGFFVGIFLYSPVNHFLDVSIWVSWFFDGMFASGSVWAINSIIEWFELNRPKSE